MRNNKEKTAFRKPRGLCDITVKVCIKPCKGDSVGTVPEADIFDIRFDTTFN